MTPRHYAMVATLLVAGGLVLFGDKTPDNAVAEPAERRAPAAAATAPAATVPDPAPAEPRGAKQEGDVAIYPLIPRAQLIGETGEGAFKSADGVFGGQTWNPPPPPQEEIKAPPPPPPTAPPLPYTVLGKAVADGQWEVFLARSEQTFVVRKGTLIDGNYRVESIAPPTMTLTYLPMNQVQQLNIGVTE